MRYNSHMQSTVVQAEAKRHTSSAEVTRVKPEGYQLGRPSRLFPNHLHLTSLLIRLSIQIVLAVQHHKYQVVQSRLSRAPLQKQMLYIRLRRSLEVHVRRSHVLMTQKLTLVSLVATMTHTCTEILKGPVCSTHRVFSRD